MDLDVLDVGQLQQRLKPAVPEDGVLDGLDVRQLLAGRPELGTVAVQRPDVVGDHPSDDRPAHQHLVVAAQRPMVLSLAGSASSVMAAEARRRSSTTSAQSTSSGSNVVRSSTSRAAEDAERLGWRQARAVDLGCLRFLLGKQRYVLERDRPGLTGPSSWPESRSGSGLAGPDLAGPGLTGTVHGHTRTRSVLRRRFAAIVVVASPSERANAEWSNRRGAGARRKGGRRRPRRARWSRSRSQSRARPISPAE